MKAIDIRYNKDVVGGKAKGSIKARLEKLDNETPTIEIKEMLAKNGHPQDLDRRRFEGGYGSCPSMSCVTCWNQVIKDE